MTYIGKFCSVNKLGTLIVPKDIPGYITPPGEILTENGQRFHFKYTPIVYHISYKLFDGKFQDDYKQTYTVEDETYIPPIPIKPGYKFLGWFPSIIKRGTIGDIELLARWKRLAILIPGRVLNETLIKLAEGDSSNIIAIQKSNTMPSDGIDISCTSTPILASFKDGIIYIYSDDDIYCNPDMSFAFANFTLLRDISGLEKFKCNEKVNIASLFDQCKLLADVSPIDNWDCYNFMHTFRNTSALLANRVPLWYRWSIKIIHSTVNNIILKEIVEDKIPGETIYHSSIKGYSPLIDSLEIESPDLDYKFIYNPIRSNN